MRWSRWVTILVVVGWSGAAAANRADLEREIRAQTAAVADLQATDSTHAATDELVLLRAWLDSAGERLHAGKEVQVRQILDRCLAQAELIRQMVIAGRLHAQVLDRQRALDDSRKRIAQLKQAIVDAQARKAELEAHK